MGGLDGPPKPPALGDAPAQPGRPSEIPSRAAKSATREAYSNSQRGNQSAISGNSITMISAITWMTMKSAMPR